MFKIVINANCCLSFSITPLGSPRSRLSEGLGSGSGNVCARPVSWVSLVMADDIRCSFARSHAPFNIKTSEYTIFFHPANGFYNVSAPNTWVTLTYQYEEVNSPSNSNGTVNCGKTVSRVCEEGVATLNIYLYSEHGKICADSNHACQIQITCGCEWPSKWPTALFVMRCYHTHSTHNHMICCWSVCIPVHVHSWQPPPPFPVETCKVEICDTASSAWTIKRVIPQIGVILCVRCTHEMSLHLPLHTSPPLHASSVI